MNLREDYYIKNANKMKDIINVNKELRRSVRALTRYTRPLEADTYTQNSEVLSYYCDPVLLFDSFV